MTQKTKKDNRVTLTLSIRERFKIRDWLPLYQGGITDTILVKGLQDKIEFSEDEIELFKIEDRYRDGKPIGIQWDSNAERPLTLKLSSAQVAVLKKVVDMADKSKLMNVENVELAVKIRELKEK
jgi:hypothetical protein